MMRHAAPVVALTLVLLATVPALAWGAIAIGDDGTLGYAHDHASKEAASAAAVQHCGRADCTVRETFQATCVATAFMQSGVRAEFSWATGPYPEQLQQQVDIICRNATNMGWQRCVPTDSFCTN